MRDRPRGLSLAICVVVCALASPARAEVTTEVAIEHPAARADPYDQTVHGLAAGPDGWLIVWNSDRDSDGSESYATRLDSSGAILDPVGIELGYIADERVQIGWDGERWLIVHAGFGVQGQTVSADGVAGEPFAISPFTSGTQLRWPALACSPDECMVAWWRFESGVGHSVRLARIVDGAVAATELPTTVATTDAHEPAIAWDGSNYLVVWRDIRRPDGGDLYGARISPAGGLVGGDFPISLQSGVESQPALAWNGSHHLVVWRDDRDGTARLYGARVTAGGGVEAADANGILIEAAPGVDPTISWTGSEHVVGWTGGAIRVDGAGASLGALAISTVASRPLAATSDGTTLLAYRDRESVQHDWDLFAAPLTGATLGARFWVAGVPSTESSPAGAHGDASTLLVWHDLRDGSAAVFGTRVAADGSSLDGAGFRISDDGVAVKPPVVAWSGESYLVVWARRAAYAPASFVLEARRVSGDGEVLDDEPIVVVPQITGLGAQPGLAMVWNGQSFLIVFHGDEYIVGTRVDADGDVLDAEPFAISTEVDQGNSPALAWSGTVHLAVWYDHRDDGSRIFAARLGLDGRPLDAENVLVGAAASFYARPTVAGSEHGFLVAGGEARRFDAAGNLIDEAPLALSGVTEEAPLLAWDGASYVVAWANVSTFGGYTSYYQARRIGLWGEPVGLPVEVASSPAVSTVDGIQPIVVASGAGRSSLFYPVRVDNTTPPLLHELHFHGRSWTEPLVQVDAGLPPADAGGGDGDGGGGGGDGGDGDAGADGGDDGGGGCGCSGGGAPSGSVGFAVLLLAIALRPPKPRRSRRRACSAG